MKITTEFKALYSAHYQRVAIATFPSGIKIQIPTGVDNPREVLAKVIRNEASVNQSEKQCVSR